MGIKIPYIGNENGEYYDLSYTSFENCGFYYDFVVGDNVIECEVCGKLTRKKSNKMRYCKECAYNIQLELTRNYKERIKKSNFG
jgi:hypothetical protein